MLLQELKLSLYEGTTAERFGKVRLAVLLMMINHLIPVLKTVLILIYADNWWRYTVCVGREETFLHDLDDLLKDRGVEVWDYGRYISLPLYHPFRPDVAISWLRL